MKAKTLLVAALMFFAFTAAAYSQAFFQVGSTPVTAVIRTGYAERAGDITFTTVTGQTAAIGTITVSYGVHITNAAGSGGIQLDVANWTGTAAQQPTILNVANGAGQVVISFGTAGGSGTFSLRGVRIAPYPNYTSGNLVAQLSASQNSNSFVAGQNQAVVITNVADGITVSTTTGVINYTNGTVTTAPKIKIKEGFLDAFGRGAGSDTTETTGLMVRLTLSGALPSDYSLVFNATASTDATVPAVFNNVTAGVVEDTNGNTISVTNTGAAVTVDSTHLKIYYLLASTSNSDPSFQETLSILPTLTYTGTTFPPPTASLTYTVTLAPIAASDGVKSDGTLTANLLTPRFYDTEISGGTLFGVSPGTGTTNFIIPFASYVVSSGYNTGIAVANTSLDPGSKALYGPDATTGAAIPQGGSCTFNMYEQITSTTATSVVAYSTTTAGVPAAIGQTSSGQVIPGSTYTVLLSDLLKAASYPSGADFNGYIIGTCSFPYGHVQYIITDFKSFANGGQGMILTGTSRTSPEALNH